MMMAASEFGESMKSLAIAEINKAIERQLSAFGDTQLQVQQVYDKQARMDLYHLGNTFDEYIRLMGSVTVSVLFLSPFFNSFFIL
jgi:sorting nexin-1/2